MNRFRGPLALALVAVSLLASMGARSAWRFYETGRGLPLFLVALAAAVLCAVLVVSAASFGAAAVGSFERPAKPPAFTKAEGALLLGLTLLAAALRFAWLGELPPLAFFDETQNVLATRGILEGQFPVFLEGATQMPAAAFYPLSLFVAAFGESVLSARVFAAVAGILAVPLFHLVARRFTSRGAALLATLLFATSRVPLGFTRLGFMGALMPVFTLASMLLLLRFLERDTARRGALFGLAAGLFTQGYYAFVAFLGVLAATALAFPDRRPSRRPVLVVAGAAALCLLPLGVFALKRPAAFLERPSTTSLHRHVPKESLVRAYATNFRATALMFHLQGDVNPRHNVPDRPLLTSGEAALFTLGLGALLAGLRGFRSRVVLAWLVVMLLPGALSFEAPQAYRTFGAMPAVFLAIGCGFDLALGISGTLRRALLVAFAGFTLAVSLENVVTYFGVQTRGPLVTSAFDATYPASACFIASVPPNAVVLVDYAVARDEELLLATHRRAQPSTVIPFSEKHHVPPGRDLLNEEAPELVYVLRPAYEKLAAPLARLSSLARVERHHDPDGALAFVTVRLPLPLTSPVSPPEPRPHPRS